MKKQILLTAGALACTAVMAHIVVDVHYTTQYDYSYVSTFYLDDISSIELFSNYDGGEEQYKGQSGIRINGNDFFSSEIDSVVWHDYIDPGLGDFSCSLTTADEVQAQMNQLYRSMNAYSDMYNGNWGFYNRLTNSHPTLDTQATGWDADFRKQSYDMNNADLNDLWSACYRGVFRCNMTIQALASTSAVSWDTAKVLIAEARTIRGFFYIQLASTFGRVPVFTIGEDHASAGTNRVCPGSYAEMWDYIIEDFILASEVLDWTPRQTARSLGNNGTMNKGIALTYLGDAYMWKAYRCPELASECYKRAADALGQVINDGPYRLNDSFTTLWDAIPRGADYLFNPEAIYVQILEDTSNWSEDVPSLFAKFYAAPPSNGGWGALFLSWEWYSAYEKGDKRRDASCVTSYVPAEQMAAFGLERSQVTYGVNPYLKEPLDDGYFIDEVSHFKYGSGEIAPAIWSMKLWRNASANNGWSSSFFCATNIYWKRLPNVMLDYAECLFNLGDESKAWEIINQLRNRAFGNLEVGKEQEIADKYLPEINRIFAADWYGFQHDSYPMPLNQETVAVPDAETYYTALKEQKHFDSPVWKVAVNEERRKEFNSEWCLRPDMERSGYLEDHIEHNYPRAYNNSIDKDYPWTDRTFIFDRNKLLFPIPIMELRRNDYCLQNPGY
ncbi:MAG: RagB/SusD family nutrient uptake outer membrane protein [Bacteroidales bacterium]|nr:RagB/SusD family nutrient uptake outer membrane protein [Candidatus Liminaster caballi]